MPRRQRELAPVVPLPTRSLVASATRFDAKTARIYNNSPNTWQAEAYRHYRICGEARFAAQFFGHALSKADLYIPADPRDKRSPKLTSGPAVDALDELFNGCEGQESMNAAVGVHLTIAGECFLIGRTPQGETDPIWEIRSVLETRTNGLPMGKGGKWWIVQGGGQPNIPLVDDDVVIRIWTPDPQESIQADSPFRSLLPILEEIEWLTRYVFAQCSSRLAGAGVWMVPEEIDFPEPPDLDGEENAERNKADKLMTLLADNMLKPIEDPSNPAAKIPIVMTAPGEHIGKQEWIKFWSELDTEAKGLRQEAIQRFALGMDLPPERVLGMSSNLGTGGGQGTGVSHWGAWQIDEDTIKMHVEPMLDVLVSAIAIYYLRPVTEDPVATIRYDTSDLRLRPDRSAEAMELYDRGLVSGEVVLRENGFDVSEAMKPDERQMWLTVKVASGSATPEMVNEALRALGVDLGPAAVPTLPMPPDINESRPPPSLEDHPNRDLPDRAAALLAGSEGLVLRALERAGNRLRQAGTKPPGVPSYETHTMMSLTPSQATEALVDAWPCAPIVLDGIAPDCESTVKTLHSYTMGLLTSGKPHTRDALAKWLATVT